VGRLQFKAKGGKTGCFFCCTKKDSNSAGKKRERKSMVGLSRARRKRKKRGVAGTFHSIPAREGSASTLGKGRVGLFPPEENSGIHLSQGVFSRASKRKLGHPYYGRGGDKGRKKEKRTRTSLHKKRVIFDGERKETGESKGCDFRAQKRGALSAALLKGEKEREGKSKRGKVTEAAIRKRKRDSLLKKDMHASKRRKGENCSRTVP